MNSPNRASGKQIRRPGRRRLLIAAITVIVLLAVVAVLHRPILRAAAAALVVQDSLVRTDLIFVLGGGPSLRPVRAAELYRAGLAPRVAIAATEALPAERMLLLPNEAVMTAWVLQRLGVPRDSIVVLRTPGGVTSTLDEGRVLNVYTRRHNLRSVIVVTSEFHTRRARWAMRRELGDSPVTVRMAPARDPRYNASNWWRHERGLLDVVEEYLKFVHNATRR